MVNTLKSKQQIFYIYLFIFTIEVIFGKGGPDSDKPSLSVSQLYLEEQRYYQREAQRTLGQRVRLYLLRFLFNLTVVCLLAGAFYLIYFATSVSQNEVRNLDSWTHSVQVAKGGEKS